MISVNTIRNRVRRVLNHPAIVRDKLRMALVRLFPDRKLISSIQQAFENPGGAEHREIAHQLQLAYGMSYAGQAPEAREFRDRLLLALCLSWSKIPEIELPPAPIGVHDLQILANSHDLIEATTFLGGFYDELAVLRKYQQLVVPGNAVIDVGANVGIHSMVFDRLVGPGGAVISFEPNPAVVPRMRRNFANNSCQSIRIEATALGERQGEIGFSPRPFNIGGSQVSEEGAIRVPINRLDDYLPMIGRAVSLIKIDVEGAELGVLRGARQLLEKEKPAIVVEYCVPPWRLSDLKAIVPYPVRILRMPNDLVEVERAVGDAENLQGFNNLLVVPA